MRIVVVVRTPRIERIIRLAPAQVRRLGLLIEFIDGPIDALSFTYRGSSMSLTELTF
jgi:hypothetical protein